MNSIDFLFFDTLDSTNDYLKERAGYIPHLTAVSAAHQTKGRGRLGRTWLDEAGSNITTSLVVYPPENLLEKFGYLPPLVSLGICDYLKNDFDLDAGVKWPNDILIGKKKLCGILCESVFSNGKFAVIIGIGLNVNQTKFDDSIKNKATSLKSELVETNINIEKSIESLHSHVLNYYYDFEKENIKSHLLTYSEKLVNTNKEVCVVYKGKNISGICMGVDDNFRLLIKTKETTLAIDAGEVSVQGIY